MDQNNIDSIIRIENEYFMIINNHFSKIISDDTVNKLNQLEFQKYIINYIKNNTNIVISYKGKKMHNLSYNINVF